MPELTVQDRMLALCLLTIDVPGVGEFPTTSIWLLDPDGKLGLRVPCPRLKLTGSPIHLHSSGRGDSKDESCIYCKVLPVLAQQECPYVGCCRGRGWNPNPDPWVHVSAAWDVKRAAFPDHNLWPDLWKRIIHSIETALHAGQDPGPAAFDVVWAVLEGSGEIRRHPCAS